ncbi:zinc-dependent alcohol dehydrogenase family protein [Aquisalimonas sp. APHAB1-3]|uniref:zinc-dependent alcohol dehydrogenase family protein n=1 Tax=unclassified Aquisalimonas TaxID=2644645 RepID=UPI0025B8F7BE|nr:zinc-dependent alcohol dehydrogenase family protein [Aquisalimonas sp.]
MLQAIYEHRGPVPQDVIDAVERETPTPGAGEVLMEVVAAPINPSDVLTLTGEYGMLPPLPAVGGNEGVGRVVQCGEGVDGFSRGQTVLLPVGCGSWATHVLAPARKLVPLPDDADPEQLAMMTVNPPTASLLMSEFVDLQPGEWLIQNAANSGVGGYLITLAKLRGLKTVNVVRRASAVTPLQEQGAEIVLVDGPDLAERVAEASGHAPVRLGIDAVGGSATDHLASALSDDATLVNYGMMSGDPCMVAPRHLVFRNLSVKGFWLARWFQHATREQQQGLYGELAGMIASGQLSARVHARFDVADIKAAVAEAASGERTGKVLVTPAV